jgi:hypothetical protein
MAVPYYTHSSMVGAPQFSTAARSTPDVLAAVLVDGFNVQAPTGGTASGGVLTLNFGSSHGYEELCHITLSGASVAGANGVWRVTSVPAGNQLTVAIPGLPDGAVGGTMSTKVAPAGWTEPFTADATTRVFRQGGGNQRYLRIHDAAGSIKRARGFEEMTSINAGTNPFPTFAIVSGEGIGLFHNAGVSGTDGWWALASDRWVYLQALRSAGEPFGLTHFGDVVEAVKPADAYCTFIGTSPSTGFMARRHDGVNFSPECTTHASTLNLAATSPISSGRRFLFGVPVCSPTSNAELRGLLPGAFLCFPALPMASASSVVAGATNVGGRLRGLHSNNSAATVAVALDEDWGI